MIFNKNKDKFFVTGGAGFIGSAFILKLNSICDCQILNFDKLSDQSSPQFLKKLNNYNFVKGNLELKRDIEKSLSEFKPNYIVHFAAESHVDRSIKFPSNFIKSNAIGTYYLLETILKLIDKKILDRSIRILNISTDEVYGSISDIKTSFTEHSQFNPSSIYSASKTSADMFVNSFSKTYKIKTQTTHCSNNFGPRQFPEKLIPSTIYKFLNNIPISVYGDGSNIRDWIFVDDHVDCLIKILSTDFIPGRFNIGASCEMSNINLVKKIEKKLKEKFYLKTNSKINFVKDRLGHDFRYSINSNKVKKIFNWENKTNFDEGLNITIKWYLDNIDWLNKSYSKQRA